MAIIVVLDIGKTNAKICALDARSGEVVYTRTTQTDTVNANPYLHLNTAAIWQWYIKELKTLQRTAPVEIIVVAAHGATGALLNDDGLVLPVMDYEFTGLDDCREEYDARCDPFEETYSPKLPLGLNLGRQLYWQRERFPEAYKKARYFLPYPQYWTWLLTGIAVAEVSTIGSHTDLWHPIGKRYSDFAKREGFDRLFPQLKHASEVVGPPGKEVQAATGLKDTCKVLVGIHDSNASLLPWMSTRPFPLTVMSTGTWVIIFSLGMPLRGLQEVRDCTANVTIDSAPVACSRFMGGREFANIAGENPALPTVEDLLTILEQQTIALPAFAETGGPYPGCTGSIKSDTALSATQKTALASIYCALVSDESLTQCHSGGDIIVEGAFVQNSLLLQCLSVFRDKQTIYTSADSTGTTIGAAMLATGLGSKRIVTPELTQVIVPDDELQRKLLDYRLLWRKQAEIWYIANKRPTNSR